MGNIAFIDGQNLYQSTKNEGWRIDPKLLMSYLKDEHRVDTALYLLCFRVHNLGDVYAKLKEAGFAVIFRDKRAKPSTERKGNIDTDLVFHVMHNLYENDSLDKVVIVSNDGDYKTLIRHLIRIGKLEKIIFPTEQSASGLYDDIDSKYKAYLSSDEIKPRVSKPNTQNQMIVGQSTTIKNDCPTNAESIESHPADNIA